MLHAVGIGTQELTLGMFWLGNRRNKKQWRCHEGRAADAPLTRSRVVWAEICATDVLVGELDPTFISRLGYDPDALTLHADLNVAPDATGKILLRLPEEIIPDYPEDLKEKVDIWEPEYDEGGDLISARGYLTYTPRAMHWGEMYLEIKVEECPFSAVA